MNHPRRALSSLTLPLALLLVLPSGCMRSTYSAGTGAPTEGAPESKKWQSHWLFGLVGGADLNLDSACPDGNATVVEKTTFGNAIVTAIALGGLVYTPTTVQVWCKK